MTGGILNAPTFSTIASSAFKGLLSVLLLSVAGAFVFGHFGGINIGSVGQLFAVLVVLWLFVFSVALLGEPMLLLKPGEIQVVRWATRAFHIGVVRSYPPQPLNAIPKRAPRGGSYLQVSLWDSQRIERVLRFRFISLADFQAEAAQALDNLGVVAGG
jgi:hypothetical protein